MSKNNSDINLFAVRERSLTSSDLSTIEKKQKKVHTRIVRSNRVDSFVSSLDTKKFFSSADLVFKVVMCCIAIGFFAVLLGNNFSFSDTMHTVLSSDLEPYDFNEWLSDIHSVIPDNPIGTVLADIVILPSTIIYVLGFALNLLIALF